MTSVILLKPGFIARDESGAILDARSSVALVTSDLKRIIVDTGLTGEERLIKEALAENGIFPEEIDIIVNTHSHPDHCGNNYLFSNAELLHPSDGETIAPGVRAIDTPGHTMDSISVIVDMAPNIRRSFENNEKTMKRRQAKAVSLALPGDALPTFNNFIKNVPPAIHVSRELAISSMAKIISIAELVIPGHDLPFSIPGRRYIKLLD